MRGLKAPISGNISLDLYRPTAGDGCVLWLPGQDDAYSATIRDRSGKGNNGTISQAVWTRLPSGLWCLGFDGLDDKATCGATDAMPCRDNLTILAWFNQDATMSLTYRSILNREFAHNYGLGIHANDKLSPWIRGVTYGGWSPDVGVALPFGVWTFGGFSWSSTADNLTWITNGTTGAVTNLIKEQLTVPTKPVTLGLRGTVTYFKGYIALVMIYEATLTASQMLSIRNQERHLFGVW